MTEDFLLEMMDNNMMKPYYKEDNIQIYCEDCLKSFSTFRNESVDLIFIDPPYNVGQEFANENLEHTVYIKLFTKWISELYKILKPTGAFYMTYYYKKLFEIGQILQSFDWKFGNLVIWSYGNMAGSAWDKRIWAFNYQPIFYFFKKDYKIDLQAKRYSNQVVGTDVWKFTGCQSNFKNPNIRKVHPSQKPVDLLKHIIHHSSNENDLILDCFMGSGTTLVAAKELGRKCIGIEISKEYCDIAINRLKNTQKDMFL